MSVTKLREELKLNAKCRNFGVGVGELSMCGIRMYAIWNLTSCVFFTKSEILVRDVLVPFFTGCEEWVG